MAEVSEFDIMRQRIREREQKRAGEAKQQVSGQFASRGMLHSGAQIKAQERARDAVARQAGEERRDVLIAEAGVRRAEKEAQKQREFQTSERLGKEAFASAEAEAQRSFTTSERIALQNFKIKQEQGRQDFTREEREAGEKFATIQADAQRKFLASESELTRQEGARQFDATFEHQVKMAQQDQGNFDKELAESRKNSRINAITALKNSGFSTSEMNAILNALGISMVAGPNSGNMDIAVNRGQPTGYQPTGYQPTGYQPARSTDWNPVDGLIR